MIPKNIKYFFILFLLFIIFFSFSTDLANIKKGGFFSDESTYYAIIQSLARDGDLEYERADIVRIREKFWVGPIGLFLKKGKDGQLFYAKSFMYPLVVAPFFRLFDVHGILLANGLMVLLVLLMGFLLLRQHHSPQKSFTFTLVYLFSSVAFIYIWWITADLFNFFINFAALFFFFYEFKKPAWGNLAGVFFAAAIFSKPNNVLHIGFLFLLLLYRKQWKKFAVMALLCMLVLAGLFAFNYGQTGSFNFQGGERMSFYGNFPYERTDFTFAGGYKMSTDNYWSRYYLNPAIVVLNLFYYIFGRFTGMFIYFFPALFLLLLFWFQKKMPEDWFLLAAAVAAILVYILVMPDNYFGGGGSLGNRYFLSIFPIFFFLGYRERIFKFTLVPLFVAVVFLSPVYMDSLFHSASPRFPGVSFPARLFPPEKTQFATLPSNTNPRAFNRKIGDQLHPVHAQRQLQPHRRRFFLDPSRPGAGILPAGAAAGQDLRVAAEEHPQAQLCFPAGRAQADEGVHRARQRAQRDLFEYSRAECRPALSLLFQGQKRKILLPLFRGGRFLRPPPAGSGDPYRTPLLSDPPAVDFGRRFS